MANRRQGNFRQHNFYVQKQLSFSYAANTNMLFLDQGYQFWTRADEDGYFSITNIRNGDYNLYAWVPGFIGDYQYESVITIIPGLILNILGNLIM